MCKYCKDLFNVDKGGYLISDLSRKQVIKMGACDIDIVLSLDADRSDDGDKCDIYLSAYLTGNRDIAAEKLNSVALTQSAIKYCPFCGTKFDNQPNSERN